MITEEKVIEMFKEGFDCGQVITMAIADDLNIDRKTALKSAATFGGGTFDAGVCGAYIGGLIALGLKYGHSEANDMATKGKMIAKVCEFKEKFAQLHSGKTACSEILGYNLTVEEDSKIIQEKNLLFTVCPKLVVDVIQIVEEL